MEYSFGAATQIRQSNIPPVIQQCFMLNKQRVWLK